MLMVMSTPLELIGAANDSATSSLPKFSSLLTINLSVRSGIEARVICGNASQAKATYTLSVVSLSSVSLPAS